MSGAEDRALDSISVGATSEFTVHIAKSDIDAFAALSGDQNPLHVDAVYAKDRGFSDCVAHGFYIGALVSRLIGMQLPGKRALLVKETLEFKKPAIAGDTIRVRGTVSARSGATRIIELDICVERGEDVLATGSAHVRVLE